MTDAKAVPIEDWQSEREAGIRLLEDGKPAEAAKQLTRAALLDSSGQSAALLGLALFRSERYAEAAQRYKDALVRNDSNEQWSQMFDLATANATAEVQINVPPVHFLERQTLLGPPEDPRLPEAPTDDSSRSLLKTARFVVGHAVGNVGNSLWEKATNTLGRSYNDEIWTNWYRKGKYVGILRLAYMREKLNSENLKSSYPSGVRVGFQPKGLERPRGVSHFRTADGSWNNLDDPKEGAAGTRFPRNVEKSVIKPANDDELLSPNPRLISRELLTREKAMVEVPFLNLLAASWIQFQNHDWISHGENTTSKVIEIPLAHDDPARTKFRQSKMFVARTQPDPTRQAFGEDTPVAFVNEVTHWWDGSQLYGSDITTQMRLRSGINGKLRVEDDGTLPLDKKGVEETGFTRNWWVGLAMFHTLFVHEHNAICDRLKKHNPAWDDDRLFNVARLVNAAVMAKIHSVEWTPAILPNPVLAMGLNANWYGILTYQFRKPEHRKTVADFNVSSPELGGLVGNDIQKHDAAFGLTEEFVEIYRLHSLLPENLRIRRLDNDEHIEDVPFVASRQAGSGKLTNEVGMANLLYSFGTQHPGQLVLNNYPRFMQELSIPGNPVFDMAAVDILRARERGVPRYNEFRRQLGLNPIKSFEDLTQDTEKAARIREIYNDDVEAIDLLVGTLAEGKRPDGFGFGETMFQIFILNASRRLQADRFFTDDYREEVYTEEGMKWVDDATLKNVLLRHYPELAATGLANVKNAFEPWDAADVLDPLRHPLRGSDPDLSDDPWRGDASR